MSHFPFPSLRTFSFPQVAPVLSPRLYLPFPPGRTSPSPRSHSPFPFTEYPSHSLTMHYPSLPFASIPLQSLLFPPLPSPSLPFFRPPCTSLPLSSLPFPSLLLSSLHFPSSLLPSLPFHSLPFPSIRVYSPPYLPFFLPASLSLLPASPCECATSSSVGGYAGRSRAFSNLVARGCSSRRKST
ncbi:unnamed protein product [Closterium sp. NIES-54]